MDVIFADFRSRCSPSSLGEPLLLRIAPHFWLYTIERRRLSTTFFSNEAASHSPLLCLQRSAEPRQFEEPPYYVATPKQGEARFRTNEHV